MLHYDVPILLYYSDKHTEIGLLLLYRIYLLNIVATETFLRNKKYWRQISLRKTVLQKLFHIGNVQEKQNICTALMN